MRIRHSASTKARIGDVCEIETPTGLVYVQYTHDHRNMGQLIRVLPGVHTSRPNIRELCQLRELYFVFYALRYALKAGQLVIVSNEPVPNWAGPYPPMRKRAARDPKGRVGWQIIDGATPLNVEVLSRIPIIHSLTPQERKLSIYELWGHTILVKELARGWTPERAEEFDSKDAEEHELRERQNPQRATPHSERLRHYLYFPEKPNAEKAAQWFRDQGFSADVRRGADGENWLALVKHEPPQNDNDLEKLREEMEALADRLSGEYDGWEVEV